MANNSKDRFVRSAELYSKDTSCVSLTTYDAHENKTYMHKPDKIEAGKIQINLPENMFYNSKLTNELLALTFIETQNERFKLNDQSLPDTVLEAFTLSRAKQRDFPNTNGLLAPLLKADLKILTNTLNPFESLLKTNIDRAQNGDQRPLRSLISLFAPNILNLYARHKDAIVSTINMFHSKMPNKDRLTRKVLDLLNETLNVPDYGSQALKKQTWDLINKLFNLYFLSSEKQEQKQDKETFCQKPTNTSALAKLTRSQAKKMDLETKREEAMDSLSNAQTTEDVDKASKQLNSIDAKLRQLAKQDTNTKELTEEVIENLMVNHLKVQKSATSTQNDATISNLCATTTLSEFIGKVKENENRLPKLPTATEELIDYIKNKLLNKEITRNDDFSGRINSKYLPGIITDTIDTEETPIFTENHKRIKNTVFVITADTSGSMRRNIGGTNLTRLKLETEYIDTILKPLLALENEREDVKNNLFIFSNNQMQLSINKYIGENANLIAENRIIRSTEHDIDPRQKGCFGGGTEIAKAISQIDEQILSTHSEDDIVHIILTDADVHERELLDISRTLNDSKIKHFFIALATNRGMNASARKTLNDLTSGEQVNNSTDILPSITNLINKGV